MAGSAATERYDWGDAFLLHRSYAQWKDELCAISHSTELASSTNTAKPHTSIISTILAESGKFGLQLTLAHQFISQLESRNPRRRAGQLLNHRFIQGRGRRCPDNRQGARLGCAGFAGLATGKGADADALQGRADICHADGDGEGGATDRAPGGEHPAHTGKVLTAAAGGGRDDETKAEPREAGCF